MIEKISYALADRLIKDRTEMLASIHEFISSKLFEEIKAKVSRENTLFAQMAPAASGPSTGNLSSSEKKAKVIESFPIPTLNNLYFTEVTGKLSSKRPAIKKLSYDKHALRKP